MILAKASSLRKVPVVLDVAADSNQYLTYTLKGGKKAFQFLVLSVTHLQKHPTI